MKILITGVAGFIGFHLANFFLKKKYKVIGVDNLNSYYSKKLKIGRLSILKNKKNFFFLKTDLNNKKFKKFATRKLNGFDFIYHFSGQAGVRYSIINPNSYIKNNIEAFVKLLEIFKESKSIKAIFYASSSSVYNEKSKMIYDNKNQNLKPNSVYAVSKVSMEYFASLYSRLYKKKIIGLRFFTVYGPWGRPDMFYYKFIKSLKSKKKIFIFNKGNNFRSYTFIDDLIRNINILMLKIKKIKIYDKIFNIGNPNSINTNTVVNILEKLSNEKAKKVLIGKQIGENIVTKAIMNKEKNFRFEFKFNLEKGLKIFYSWFIKNKSL